jgi:hypothetical protein
MDIERMQRAPLLWLTLVGYGLLAIVALSSGIYVIASVAQMLAAGW